MPDYHNYRKCIEACLNCAALCLHCASSCTKEKEVKMMARCIQLDMECSALCNTTAQLMSLGSDLVKEILRTCIVACDACGDECRKFDNQHCRECAEACKKCAEESRKM